MVNTPAGALEQGTRQVSRWASARGLGGREGWLVAGRLLVRPPVSLSVEQDALTAPDELAVALRGWLHRRCVNVCMNGWMLGNVVKRFEWPLNRKAVCECSLCIIRSGGGLWALWRPTAYRDGLNTENRLFFNSGRKVESMLSNLTVSRTTKGSDNTLGWNHSNMLR